LEQINRGNVTNLQQVWIYHSRDGSNQIQCNPIIAGDIMLVPTTIRTPHLRRVNLRKSSS
jgi:glucose dehydrogenase